MLERRGFALQCFSLFVLNGKSKTNPTEHTLYVQYTHAHVRTAILMEVYIEVSRVVYVHVRMYVMYIYVHPESFRSNAQNAIAFARRYCPRVHRSDRLRAFSYTVCDRVRVRACVRSHLRACEVHLIKEHQIKLHAHAHVYTRTCTYIYTENAR